MKQDLDILETPYLQLYIQDGILYINYKEIENLDLEVAIACVAARKDFTKNQPFPCLVDAVNIHHFTKEARDYFANEGNDGITANAILTKSAVIKMMANFYITVNKPVNPTRTFTDKQAALEWLQKFK